MFIPELQSNEGNKHRNNSQVSASRVRHDSTYIILFLTQHDKPKMTIKNTIWLVDITSHLLCLYLVMTSQLIVQHGWFGIGTIDSAIVTRARENDL